MPLNYQGVDPVAFESVSAVTATPSVDLGTRRTFNGEDYVYVYNAGGSQAVPGNLMVPSANTGYSCTLTSVTAIDFPFGFVKHATLTTATYGWLLTRGFTNVQNGMASTALAQGDLLGVAANGKVQVYLTATLITGPIIGTVLQATGSAGTAYAYVRCFG